MNGYRWDDFKAYVYVSENYGQTWKDISSNLPASPVNVIREDPENENVLYVGTDNGAYVSFNQGDNWEAFSEGLPNVAVHDLVIQKREKDIILGTHGRSLYLADVTLLQQMNDSNKNDIVFSEIESLQSSSRWGSKYGEWYDVIEPSVTFQFYSPKDGKATISIQTDNGNTLKQLQQDVVAGVNVVNYNASISEKGAKLLDNDEDKVNKADNGTYYLPKGIYNVVITIDGKSKSQKLELK